jgi:type IV pilus assembly protein PilC
MDALQPASAVQPSPRAEFWAWLLFWIPVVAGLLFCLAWEFQNAGDDTTLRILLTLLLIIGLPLFVGVGLVVALSSYTLRHGLGLNRRRQGMAILGYLENAMRLNFPLDRYLLAAQESEHGAVRRLLTALRLTLSRGMPVGEALERAVPEVPSDAAGTIQAAEKIGQLQPTLSRLIAQESLDNDVAYDGTTPFYRFYIPLMLFAIAGALVFFSIFVAPKFRDIFKDFHANLPPATQWLFDVLGVLTNNDFFLPIFFWTFVGIFVAVVARGLQRTFQRLRGVPGRTAFAPPLSLRPLMWYVPLWRGWVSDRTMATVLEFLADALRSGLPLVQAVNASMQLGMPSPLRRKIGKWRNAMLAGSTPAEAARHAGLPQLLAGFLQTPSKTSAAAAAPEMFDFLAAYYHERVRRLAIFLRAAAEPLAVLLLGILVCQVVLALFTPLVALMNAAMAAGEKGFL